jgi:hypothetical protein
MRLGSIHLVGVLFLALCFVFCVDGPAVHGQSLTNAVQDVEFSVEHGFYDSPFQLTLSTPTQTAQIRYTLDGSTPKSNTGIVYGGPLTIAGTTVVRAAAFKPNYQDPNVVTKTYIFVSDVIRQSPNGQPPGPGWPTGNVNGQVIDYGMDPDIVNDPRWAGLIEDALLDIPSISLVTDLANLFDRNTGIYVHAGNDGINWERRTSVELLNPDGTPGFDSITRCSAARGWTNSTKSIFAPARTTPGRTKAARRIRLSEKFSPVMCSMTWASRTLAADITISI